MTSRTTAPGDSPAPETSPTLRRRPLDSPGAALQASPGDLVEYHNIIARVQGTSSSTTTGDLVEYHNNDAIAGRREVDESTKTAKEPLSYDAEKFPVSLNYSEDSHDCEVSGVLDGEKGEEKLDEDASSKGAKASSKGARASQDDWPSFAFGDQEQSGLSVRTDHRAAEEDWPVDQESCIETGPPSTGEIPRLQEDALRLPGDGGPPLDEVDQDQSLPITDPIGSLLIENVDEDDDVGAEKMLDPLRACGAAGRGGGGARKASWCREESDSRVGSFQQGSDAAGPTQSGAKRAEAREQHSGADLRWDHTTTHENFSFDHRLRSTEGKDFVAFSAAESAPRDARADDVEQKVLGLANALLETQRILMRAFWSWHFVASSAADGAGTQPQGRGRRDEDDARDDVEQVIDLASQLYAPLAARVNLGMVGYSILGQHRGCNVSFHFQNYRGDVEGCVYFCGCCTSVAPPTSRCGTCSFSFQKIPLQSVAPPQQAEAAQLSAKQQNLDLYFDKLDLFLGRQLGRSLLRKTLDHWAARPSSTIGTIVRVAERRRLVRSSANALWAVRSRWTKQMCFQALKTDSKRQPPAPYAAGPPAPRFDDLPPFIATPVAYGPGGSSGLGLASGQHQSSHHGSSHHSCARESFPPNSSRSDAISISGTSVWSRADSGWAPASVAEFEHRFNEINQELELQKAELSLQEKLFNEERLQLERKVADAREDVLGRLEQKPPSSFGQRESGLVISESGVFRKFQFGKGERRREGSARAEQKIFLVMEANKNRSGERVICWAERTSLMLRTTKKLALQPPHVFGLAYSFRSAWDLSGAPVRSRTPAGFVGARLRSASRGSWRVRSSGAGADESKIRPELCFLLVGRDRDLELVAPNFSQFLNWFLGLQYLVFLGQRDGLRSLTWNFADVHDMNNALILNAAGQCPLLMDRRKLVLRYVGRKLLCQANGSRELVRDWIVTAVEEVLLGGGRSGF